ncbi:MACPF domain-containing protein At4g24290-like isoform X3 [Elaeis guineensis]|uniref:MACPF domain-containing protein At4g24290-like isoform X3 n=1 Tax=Elaeis guineensis var. tenera TaxID=51953 RepID=UPI003C6D13F9
MALKASPLEAAEIAIHSIGLGYDIADDIRLKYCKRGSPDPCLIELSNDEVQEIVLPGGISIPNVPKSIKCDKGERMRFRSDVLSFQRMSELFNQKLSLSGKIPSGLFNHTFEFSGCWQKDAANTKSLAFDGWFITLYTVALTKSQIVLRDHVKQAVPSSWDPAALARFIEKFGTHVIVGVKMGGKDVIYMRQQHSSNLQPIEVQKGLKDMADKRLPDVNGQYGMNADEAYEKDKVDHRERRLRFVESSPSSSYSTKEINHQLQNFISFWSFSYQGNGPLFLVTFPLDLNVDAGKRPVTGLRLYLEGRRSNRLAIHLQHLSSLPRIFELQDDPTNSFSYESHDRKYYEPLQCRHFSHICTAPVESGDFSIVTGAQLHVAHHGLKKVLFLRLHFSTVTNATLVKNPEWEGSPSLAQKSGIISTLISTHFTAAFQKQPPRPADVNVNSAVYPGGPPVPIQTPKLLKLIDTTEMVRGPQVMPGYWVVSGAKLHVERGKISLRVKYSLFTVCLPDDEYME